MTEELKSYPFCGGTDSEDNATQQAAIYCTAVRAATGQRAYRVECQCGASGSIELENRAAVGKWNRRASLAPAGSPMEAEPVAYQQFKDGKWVECSHFVAFGWGDTMDKDCRALYAAPASPDADLVKVLRNIRTHLHWKSVEMHAAVSGARDTHTDGFFDGLIYAVVQIDAALAKVDGREGGK